MTRTGDLFRGLYGIASDVTEARVLLGAGVRVLQLRDKTSDGRALLAAARALRALTREAGALFVVNDRLDIALMAGADGVHVGQDDLPVSDVRRVAAQVGRESLIVGLSTHDAGQVRAATKEQVDYLGFGPLFATSTKRDALAPRGTGLLAEAVHLAGALPVVAIGGITLSDVPDLRAAGARMAAVIGDIFQATEPAARAAALHQALL